MAHWPSGPGTPLPHALRSLKDLWFRLALGTRWPPHALVLALERLRHQAFSSNSRSIFTVGLSSVERVQKVHLENISNIFVFYKTKKKKNFYFSVLSFLSSSFITLTRVFPLTLIIYPNLILKNNWYFIQNDH